MVIIIHQDGSIEGLPTPALLPQEQMPEPPLPHLEVELPREPPRRRPRRPIPIPTTN